MDNKAFEQPLNDDLENFEFLGERLDNDLQNTLDDELDGVADTPNGLWFVFNIDLDNALENEIDNFN